MQKSRSHKLRHSEAILLKTTAYGEADLIVSLLGPDVGLIKGFARSAKKSVKRFGGSISLFATSVFHYQESQSDLKIINDTELVSLRNNISSDLQSFAVASYGIELVELLLVAEDSNPAIYSLLSGFLDYLNLTGDSVCAKLLFELRLIEALGYLPHLLHCSECYADIRQQISVAFEVHRGGVLCGGCAGHQALSVSPGTLGSLSRSLKGPYHIFSGYKFSSKTLSEGGTLLAAVYGNILPKEPKTLKFMAQLGGPRS